MDVRTVLALALLAPLLGCGGGNPGTIEASGTIEGTDVHIASQVVGQILEVRVAEGSTVEAGDTLVVIDATEYLLQLNQARATMRMHQSSYRLAVVSGATVVTILTVIFVVQDLARQPVLVTSLASSTFLLYYQPGNEINRLRPLVFGHLI